jgi:CHAT domain-containing protein/Flp pilus assembly protein TadD
MFFYCALGLLLSVPAIGQAQPEQLLARAQELVDSAQYEAALTIAQQAEAGLLSKMEPDDRRLWDVYAMIGLASINSDTAQLSISLEKLHQLGEPKGNIRKGNLLYLTGCFDQIHFRFQAAYMAFDSAITVYSQLSTDESQVQLAKALLNQANIAQQYGDSEICLSCCKKAEPMLSEQFPADHPLFSKLYNLQGLGYQIARQKQKADERYLKALQIAQKSMSPTHQETGYILNNLGMLYNSMGRFYEATRSFERALAIANTHNRQSFLSIVFHNLSINYVGRGQNDKAITFAKKCLAIEQEIYPADHTYIPRSYDNLSVIFRNSSQPDSALIYAQKALALTPKGSPSRFHMLNSVGLAEETLENYDQAVTLYRESLASASEFEAENKGSRLFVEETYLNLGRVYTQLGALDSAVFNFKKTLASMGVEYSHTASDFQSIRVNEGISLLKTYEHYLNARRLIYKKSQNHSDLMAWEKLAEEAFDALIFYQKAFSNPENKRLAPNLSPHLLEQVTLASSELYQRTQSPAHLADIYQFMESNKSIVLQQALQTTQVLRFAGIPSVLLEEEENLRIRISQKEAERDAYYQGGASENDSIIGAINSSLEQLSKQHQQMLQRFEANDPVYYQAVHDLSTLPLKEVQQDLLAPGESLVEYLVGDRTIFILVVQPDTVHFRQVEKEFPLADWVTQMVQQGIGYQEIPFNQRTGRETRESFQAYNQSATQLYDKLWAPIQDLVGEKVIIIPDAQLNYLPFEALLSQEPEATNEFGSYPYLIRRHEIRYSYSAGLWQQMRDRVRKPSEHLLAMAPFAGQGLTLSTQGSRGISASLDLLKGSLEEVEQISGLLGGKVLLNETASLDTFWSVAPVYRFLHLSTHGQAEDSTGDLAFLAMAGKEPGTCAKLYARDLYNSRLNAELVFLSACETGIGEFKQNEGIISLARAFAYAGAGGIITTLWQVDDDASKDLSVGFYREVKAGRSYATALRRAKLTYLETQAKNDPRKAHPFYWSGLIGIGSLGK